MTGQREQAIEVIARDMLVRQEKIKADPVPWDRYEEVRATFLDSAERNHGNAVDALIAAGVIRETDNTGDDADDDDSEFAKADAFDAAMNLFDATMVDDFNIHDDLDAAFEIIWSAAMVARSSGVADTTKDLDPTPFRLGSSVERSSLARVGPLRLHFAPRPEFEQDQSKYPHMQGVADTVKEDNKRFTESGDPIMGDVDFGGWPES
jgi:hypothetical protein